MAVGPNCHGPRPGLLRILSCGSGASIDAGGTDVHPSRGLARPVSAKVLGAPTRTETTLRAAPSRAQRAPARASQHHVASSARCLWLVANRLHAPPQDGAGEEFGAGSVLEDEMANITTSLRFMTAEYEGPRSPCIGGGACCIEAARKGAAARVESLPRSTCRRLVCRAQLLSKWCMTKR